MFIDVSNAFRKSISKLGGRLRLEFFEILKFRQIDKQTSKSYAVFYLIR